MVDTWITLPYGGAGAGFDAQNLVQHIQASGRDYIVQGQTKCVLAKHPKRQSLDVWLRTYFTKQKDTAQAVNEVVAQLVATGLFAVGKFPCPDSGHLCKGLRLVNAPAPKSLPVDRPSPSHAPVRGSGRMKEVSSEPSSQQNRAEGPSLAELFHLVSRVIPDGQSLTRVTPDKSVAQALGVMLEKNYSQLPVVQGTAVLGVFSFRSFASRLLTLSDLPQDVGTLPVGEFLEQFQFVQKSDTWESTLDYIDRHDAVLVGHRDGVEAILTSMDVLNYLRGIANPFVMLAEIELSLRSLIQGCADADKLAECTTRSLQHKYGRGELPTDLQEMTFDDYVLVVTNGENWPLFAEAFGEGEWQRKQTAQRLRKVRDLRNDIFHFRRELTHEDHALLSEQREWLQNKYRAFVAKKRVPPRGEGERGPRPEPQLPENVLRGIECVATATSEATAGELQRFLQGCLDLGLAPYRKASWSLPFRMYCLRTSGEDPTLRRRRIAVFYLVLAEEPYLTFPTTSQHTHVPGFDTDRLVGELKRLGFTEAGVNAEPRAYLSARTSAEFFARLLDVVRDTIATFDATTHGAQN